MSLFMEQKDMNYIEWVNHIQDLQENKTPNFQEQDQ